MEYQELGFKCGIEIHQRLDTRKLYCDCYCDPNKGNGEALGRSGKKISRRLHAVVGETGKIDPAAAFESLRSQKFTYLFDDSNSCLVEADEEPPHAASPEALQAALVFSRMLGARVADTIFVMRKTVIDGSAVSGFQRTALVAMDGKIQTSLGYLDIPTIALEEESSGIVEKRLGETVFRLDRQGIPLLEVATSPNIKNGIHAMEAAEKIGSLMRSTGKVQRGLGSIRQDLNVSISQGARVEIKGVQDLKLIPALIENEVARQINLLKVRGELQSRHILLGDEHFSIKEVTSIFSNTGCKLIGEAKKRNEKVFALKLQSFAQLFKAFLMPGHTLGAEIAGHVRAHSMAKGIIHTDEALEEKYSMNVSEISLLDKQMNAANGDLLILCIGPEDVCRLGLRAAFDRCVQLQKGVPEETRRAEGEISIFMRPLPGSARMYPETDLSPIPITQEMIREAESKKPEAPDDKKARYQKAGLGLQLAEKMVKSPEWDRFEKLLSKSKAPPQLIAITLLETLISLKREGVAIERLNDSDLLGLFEAFSTSAITKAAIPELIKLKCANYGLSFDALAGKHNLKKLPKDMLLKISLSTPGTSEKKFAQIMKLHRLQVDPKELQEILEGKQA